MRKAKIVPGSRTKNSRVNLDRITVPSGNPGQLPADLPMKMIVDRVFGVLDDAHNLPIKEGVMGHTVGLPIGAQALLGHVVGLDFYDKGHGSGTYIEINVYRDPNAIKIEVNGEEKWRWVEDKSELPMRTSEVITEQRRTDGEWVDQVDLQPGDEVLDDNEIIRTGDEVDLYDGPSGEFLGVATVGDDEELVFDDEEDDDDIVWD